MATITIRETDSPSRSKQAGPCWIAIDGTYAAAVAREVEAEPGQTVTSHAQASQPHQWGPARVDADRDW